MRRLRPNSPTRANRARTFARGAVAATLASALSLGGASAAFAVESSVPAAANPALAQQCEMDFAISLDLSNSVTDPQLAQARQELSALADSLEGYPIRFAVHNFASNAPATGSAANASLPLTSVADAAGVSAIQSYINGVQRPASAQGGTNWDRGIAAIAAAPESYDALFFLTDGNPTQYSSPVQGPGNSTNQATIDAAVRSANALKGEGTRIIPIGVNDNIAGNDLATFREHISQISGPTQGSDYYLAGFSALSSTLIDIVNAKCATIDLEKTGSLASGATGVAGDTVNYAFTVTNTGTVALHNVTLTDPKPGLSAVSFGTWPGAAGVLEPKQSVTASAQYTLTEEDIAAGEVANTATTSGTPPAGQPVTDQSPALVTLPELTPGISLEKTGVLTGNTIAYSFTATNTGDVRLTSVSIADELEGLSDVVYGAWPDAVGALAPGQSVTASATYTVTQADRDAGAVDNTATTTGTPPTGPAVTDDDDFTQPLGSTPAITLEKTGTLTGNTIAYTFTATNTGTVTLTAISISDQLDGLSDITYGTWPASAGVLAPGQSVTATANYTVTQSDRDAGTVDNTATTSGTPPTGPAVTDEDDFDQPLDGIPAITLVKTGSLSGNTISYTFTATNTGTVTLKAVSIADELDGLSDIAYGTWPAAAGVLAPGQSITATATYSVTQSDRDAGGVDNTATTTGTPPTGLAVTDEDDFDQPLATSSAISLVKTGSLSGDTISYTFTATNTGNVTLKAVSIADELDGLSDIAYGTWPAAAGVLAPGQSITATATYSVTQSDRDAGGVDNTATTTGTPPTGPAVTDEDDFDQPLAPAPAISLVKTGALDGNGSKVDSIDYRFTVTNTGNVTLKAVSIADELDGLSDIAYGTWPAAAGVLAPGQSVTATANYTVTLADRDAGSVTNTATTTGTPPTGPPVTDEDDFEQPLGSTPGIALVKTGELDDNVIRYEFTATNTGNVTLTAVSIADELNGLSDIVFGEWPDAPGVLTPGQSVTATATYEVTQADRDAGAVNNTATTTGTPPTGPSVTDEDNFDQPLPSTPAISLVKTGVISFDTSDGDIITYELAATNIGDVTLSGVAISDELAGLSDVTYGEWPTAVGVLAPGESVKASASYTVTQEDRDAGGVLNTATTTGTPPTGPSVTDEDEFDQPLASTPAIALVKTGLLTDNGNTINYTFTATNIGTVTLNAVVIADELDGVSDVLYGQWPAAPGVLTPGQSVTATASYTVTQTDRNAGSVVNRATTAGTPPTGSPVTDEDDFTQPLTPAPAISLVKTGALNGDTITYSFTATNTGNVTLTSVAITDALRGLSAITYSVWPAEAGVLAPGASVTATATYTVTDADRSAGSITNNATVTGTPPTGTPITDEASVRTALQPAGVLASTGIDGDRVLRVGGFGFLTLLLGAAAVMTGRRKRA